MHISRRACPTLALIALLVGGTALRLDFAQRAVPFVDDYGTASLMSWHILEGREFPLYFYGFAYIGALGAYVGAGAFALFGPSLLSLCIAMLPFSLLWIVATYLLFRRLAGEWAGVIAAAVVAFAPTVVMHYSFVPLIGYPPTFAFGTLILYLGVRLNDGDLTGRAEWLCVLGLGLLAGLAFWTNSLSVPYLVVGFGLLLTHVVKSRFNRALLLKLAAAFVLFAAALLPVIVTALQRGLTIMFGHWPSSLRYIPANLPVMVNEYLPDQLLAGARMPPAVNWLVGAIYAVLGVGFIVGLAVALVRRNRRALRAALVPLSFTLVFLLFFLSNSKSHEVQVRYFTPFYLGIAGCVALPFAYRRARLTAATALLATVLIVHNVTDTLSAVHGATGRGAARWNAAIDALVGRTEHEGLRHVMIEPYNGQAMTFQARERVIFARTRKERRYAYAISAAADDTTGFAKPDEDAPTFEATLGAVGVTAFDSFSAGGWTVFHNIELPTDQLHLLEPATASSMAPDGIVEDAAALIDRDDETILAGAFADETALVVDFGRNVRLSTVRFVAADETDYPVAYTFAGALDDSDPADWIEFQRVESRLALACVTGNRLYHRDHSAMMECRFEPTQLRYLKITGFRSASPNVRQWRLQQAYFYENAPGSARPNEQEARRIARELDRRGVELAVCDEWLSRKMDLMPQPHPDVWPRHEFRYPASQVSRVVPIRRRVAVVAETPHASEVAELLNHATLGDAAIVRHDFAHYAAFIIEQAPPAYETYPGLRWNGRTLTRTARIATADWYHEHGERLERVGRREDASRYFRRSFETFPGIRANLQRLAPGDEAARALLASLTPAGRARCEFPGGYTLVGYTLDPSPLVPGETATLRLVWQLDGTIPHSYLPVFVHFVVDDTTAFQADHNATFPVTRGTTVPPVLVLDEHTVTVPADCPPGVATIRLGALTWSDPGRRLKPRTALPTRSRAVEIGTAQIAR